MSAYRNGAQDGGESGEIEGRYGRLWGRLRAAQFLPALCVLALLIVALVQQDATTQAMQTVHTELLTVRSEHQQFLGLQARLMEVLSGQQGLLKTQAETLVNIEYLSSLPDDHKPRLLMPPGLAQRLIKAPVE